MDDDPYQSASKNKEEMTNLIPQIKTITIFNSSRAVEINGIKVDHMQPIAMVDGDLHSHGENLDELFLEVLREELKEKVEHITVLLGNGLVDEDITRIEKLLHHDMPDLDEDIIEIHLGEQPHFNYLISVLEN